MTRLAGSVVAAVVGLWVIAHVLYLGPIRDATELTIAWGLTIIVVAGLIAACVMLAVALLVGRTSPMWLRFVEVIRTAAAVVGAGLVVVGLLHYRDTEPQSDVTWLVAGVVVLAGAGIVHWWVLRARRSALG